MQQSTLLGVATKYRPEHFLLCWKFVMHSHDLTQWDFLGPKCLQSSLIWPPISRSKLLKCQKWKSNVPHPLHLHQLKGRSFVVCVTGFVVSAWLPQSTQSGVDALRAELFTGFSIRGREGSRNVGTKYEDETEKKMTFYWSWWSENRFSNISMLVKLYCSRAFQHGGVSLVTEPYFCV